MSRVRRAVLLAKAPIPGTVKTRLCPPLSPEQAAEVAKAFLRDTAAAAAVPGTALTVAFTPPEAGAEMRELLGAVELIPQADGDLGERLRAVFAAFPGETVVALGSDAPDLPPALVGAAFEVLESGRADVALGPARDGGYYLIGAREPPAALFTGIAWSSGDVLAATLRRSAAGGLRPFLLPEWEDVDTPEDLVRLRARLAGTQAAVAPHTRAALRALGAARRPPV